MFRPSHSGGTAPPRSRTGDLGVRHAGLPGRVPAAGASAAAGILGGSGYLYELPDIRVYSAQWDLLVSDKLSEAIDHWYESGLDDLVARLHGAFGASNVEAVYTHWGSAFKAAAHVLGLPVGSYDRSRPPQPPTAASPARPLFEPPTPPSGSCPARRDSRNEIGEADLLGRPQHEPRNRIADLKRASTASDPLPGYLLLPPAPAVHRGDNEPWLWLLIGPVGLGKSSEIAQRSEMAHQLLLDIPQ